MMTASHLVTVHPVVYYCTSQSSTCYVDPIRVKLALRTTPSGPEVAAVDIPVKKPGG